VVEIEFGVEPVELGRSEQRVDGCGAFSARVRSGEEIDDMTASIAADGIG